MFLSMIGYLIKRRGRPPKSKMMSPPSVQSTSDNTDDGDASTGREGRRRRTAVMTTRTQKRAMKNVVNLLSKFVRIN